MVTTGLLQNTSPTIEILNELISYCEDGLRGYSDASESASSSQLRSFFQKQEQERAQFSAELQDLVSMYGGEADDSGSFQGRLHRAWLITRDKLSASTDQSLLKECMRGETIALEHYDDALKQDLPFDVHQVVLRQKSAIEAAKTTLELYCEDNAS